MKLQYCILFSTLLLIGCAHEPNYDYEDVLTYHIDYHELFNLVPNHYFAYIYSYSCGYCEEIKDFIIKERVVHKKEIFYITYTNDIPIKEDISDTLFTDNLDNFGILGTPSLIEIKDKKIVQNLAGLNDIKSYLNGGVICQRPDRI